MSKISAKHALTDQEVDFCKRRAAGLVVAAAYRRAFLIEYKGSTYENGKYDKFNRLTDGAGDPITAKEVSRRASLLAKQDHITAYLTEMGESASARARDVLAEQALFGDDQAARGAAKQILEQEDKLGFRDAVQQFWDVTCEAGADIVVPLPERFVRTYKVPCTSCDELIEFKVDEQLEATVPVAAMFGEKR